MSLRPSRIHHLRKPSAWERQFGLDRQSGLDDVSPSELQRLPGYIEDDARLGEEEAEGVPGGPHTGPRSTCDAGVPPALAAGTAAPQTRPGDPWEVPGKLRHLKVAAERGHLEAMYLLAQECDDRVSRIHWLTMAAERGHVAAMHDLGLASAALHERRRWLLRAARHGWSEAMAELGDVECS